MGNEAIWTFVADDGFYKSCLKYRDLFKKYNLKGTVALVTDWVDVNYASGDKLATGCYCGNWDEWKDLVDEGYIDIANHSTSHQKLTKVEDLDGEINDSFKKIPFEVLGFVCPYGETSVKVIEKIKENHLACRTTDDGYNSIQNPNWYRLKTKYANKNLDKMNNNVDQTIREKTWIIEMWHGLDGEGWKPIDSSICEKHLEYVSKQVAEGKIQILTFNDAIRKIRGLNA